MHRGSFHVANAWEPLRLPARGLVLRFYVPSELREPTPPPHRTEAGQPANSGGLFRSSLEHC